MRELSVSHEVVLVALSEGPVDPAHVAKVEQDCGVRVHVVSRSRLTTAWSLVRSVFTGVPLMVGYFLSPGAARRIDEIVADERPDRIFCQLIRTAEYGRGRAVPTTIDFQDAFSVSAQRRADRAPFGLRQLLSVEASRTRRYEAEAFGWFDHHTIISAQDRDLLRFPGAERIEIVTSAVDTEFFHPMDPPADQRDISFVGNMGYAPNVNAAELLVEEILPLVRAGRPGADVLLAGARPSRSVTRLEGPGVEVSGWVEDIRTAYARGRVMVAPLVIGAGQQNKILEAMAMGVPCVTTPLVNRAIGAEPGREIMVGEDPAALAAAILELLGSPELRRDMAARARTFVQDRYSWRSIGETLGAVLERPAASTSRQSAAGET
jgi:glycosyltransferase involved in cell wall biosynthesis